MKKLPKILEVDLSEPQLIELGKAYRKSIFRLFCIFLAWLLIVLGIAATFTTIIIWSKGDGVNVSTFIFSIILMIMVVILGLGRVINSFLLRFLGYRKIVTFRRFFSSQFILRAFDPLIRTLNKDIIRICPFCGKRLYLSAYSFRIKYIFRLSSPLSFEILCDNCNPIILNLEIRKRIVRFTTYIEDIEHVDEREVWEKISEDRVNKKLLDKVRQLRRYMEFSKITYYAINKDYDMFFGDCQQFLTSRL